VKKEDLILAALAVSDGAIHTPVQIQKLLFLIDSKIPDLVGGPLFNFAAYAYGPFDKEIYYILEELERVEDVDIIRSSDFRWPRYRLTSQGQKKGDLILQEMDSKATAYIKELSSFVRGLSFAELVSVDTLTKRSMVSVTSKEFFK